MFFQERFFPPCQAFSEFPTLKPPENGTVNTLLPHTLPSTEVLILHVAVVQLVAFQEIVVLGDREAVGQCSPKGIGQGARRSVHASLELVGSCRQHRVFI